MAPDQCPWNLSSPVFDDGCLEPPYCRVANRRWRLGPDRRRSHHPGLPGWKCRSPWLGTALGQRQADACQHHATLQWLGVVPSFSRPHVSDDNPHSEALFRTLKHTPAYQHTPFANIPAAQRWIARFTDWYNGEHRHSGIRYVTPNQRHEGHECDILGRRHQLYELARRSNPGRWISSTRNWNSVGLVVLNPPGAVADTPHLNHATTILTLTAGIICYPCDRNRP